MSKELVISANRHETKVAILEDDQLVEVFFQRANEYSLAGSIHKGRVTRVLPGMQSAFVDLGLERDTFLYVSDFFEEAEEDFVKLGLKPFFVTENDSKVAVKYSSVQLQSLMDAIKTNFGADVLSAPRVITLAGRQAAVSATEVQTIAGKEETLGPSIDLLPSISADGVSVDLDAKIRVAVALAQ